MLPLRQTILVVEDEAAIADTIVYALKTEGFSPAWKRTAAEALEVLRTEEVALAILDVGLPDASGLDVCREIRRRGEMPVVILTARSAEVDRIVGLELGADDYVTKPFNPMEVLARVKSQLRRYTLLGGMEGKETCRLVLGGIVLDDAAKAVTVDGEAVSLTPTEYSILKLLMEKPGHVFSSAEIYGAVWKGSAIGMENTVAVHIRHIREKLEINPAKPRYIKVVWGHGYKMERGLL